MPSSFQSALEPSEEILLRRLALGLPGSSVAQIGRLVALALVEQRGGELRLTSRGQAHITSLPAARLLRRGSRQAIVTAAPGDDWPRDDHARDRLLAEQSHRRIMASLRLLAATRPVCAGLIAVPRAAAAGPREPQPPSPAAGLPPEPTARREARSAFSE